MEDPKQLWRPWAAWAKEHRGFIDVEFLEADTHGDLALIVMSAVRR